MHMQIRYCAAWDGTHSHTLSVVPQQRGHALMLKLEGAALHCLSYSFGVQLPIV